MRTTRASLRARIGTLVATMLLAAPASLMAQEVERYLLSAGDLAIYNLAGELEVVGGSGSDVRVDIQRGGADAAALRVETGPARDRQTLRVIYPEDRIVYPALDGSRTTLRVRDDGTFGHGTRSMFNSRRVAIRGRGDGLRAHADLRVEVPRGQAIAFYLGTGRVSVENVDGEIRVDAAAAPVATRSTRGALRIDVGSGAVSVRDAEGTVDVDTGSGHVAVAGALDGQVRIDTGSGRVEATDVQGRQLHIDTGSGSVSVARVSVNDLVVDTGSGSIDVAGLRTASARLDTGSGSIDVGLEEAIESLGVDTGSGSVSVALPDGIHADLDIETGSGGIELDIPVQAVRTSRSRFVGRLGDGGGQIEIDTGSGGVRLVRS